MGGGCAAPIHCRQSPLLGQLPLHGLPLRGDASDDAIDPASGPGREYKLH